MTFLRQLKHSFFGLTIYPRFTGPFTSVQSLTLFPVLSQNTHFKLVANCCLFKLMVLLSLLVSHDFPKPIVLMYLYVWKRPIDTSHRQIGLSLIKFVFHIPFNDISFSILSSDCTSISSIS